MAVTIRWHPPLIPEERKKVQWESIIRSALRGQGDAIEVGLRFAEDRLRWRVETQDPAAVYRSQVVHALLATGKPVE